MIRKVSIISLVLSVLLIATAAFAQTKIDPFLDDGPQPSALKASSLSTPSRSNSGGAARIRDVFVKSTDAEATRAAIESAGGTVHTIAGGILTATIPAGSAAEIARGEEVVFIEAAKPIHFKNDLAGIDINSNEVHEGVDLPASYSGKGVIVGVIDTGIDYRHPDFLDAEGKSRVLAIWDQKRPDGPAPIEIGGSFGTECTQKSIADGSCPIRDTDGHGTHVAGTIAARNDTYGGIAPDANIVAVVYDSSLDLSSGYADTIFSTKICQAAYYVFAKAKALGLPAVVNLSLGTHLGAHDGTSLFEECLSELIKPAAGRAIVAAAGNETSTSNAYTGIHAGSSVAGMQATNFVILKVSRDRVYYLDIWEAPGSDLSFGLAIRNGLPPEKAAEQSGLVAPGTQSDGTFEGGEIAWAINATETESALNGKPHVGIRITLGPGVSDPKRFSFDLIVKGKGSFDAWLFPDKPAQTVEFTSVAGSHGAEWAFVPGDRVESVAIPATAPEIIAVAAYATRNRWEAAGASECCQVPFTLGAILDFSSSGPSADPEATGQKPEIAAPGAMIASTLSEDSKPNNTLVLSDGKHVLQAGTSMAAPFVSGTIALMFSANVNFTAADAKRYITESAVVDDHVGEVPNDRWGFGKLDVLAAVEAAIAGGASGTFDTNSDLATPPERADGSGGCALIPKAQADARATLFLGWGLMMLFAGRRLLRAPRRS